MTWSDGSRGGVSQVGDEGGPTLQVRLVVTDKVTLWDTMSLLLLLPLSIVTHGP